jgi:O-acetylhomoserine (thiol)-lyase
MTEENYGLGTRALHAGQEPDPTTNARAVPIYATTSYVFNDTDHAAALFGLAEFGNIYSRIMNPTVDVLEKRLAALDGGVMGLGFASGQSAVNAAILTICHSGQNFVSATSLYGGTWTLFNNTFKNLGIEVRFFDPAHPEQIHDLVDENTRLVYIESMGNPKNDVPDFKAIAEAAHSAPHGSIPVICDNTVMTPCLFRPFEYGIDINVYSTTKFIGGHGAHVGGCIVDSGNFQWTENRDKWPEFCGPSPNYHGAVLADALAPMGNIVFCVQARTHWLRDTGAAMSPFAAFLFLQGIETLHLRMPRHCENAQAVAEHLEQHDAVEWVNYPEGRDPRLWHQGRHGSGQEVHQLGEALLAPREHRRRQDASHSSRFDDSPAVEPGGAAADGRRAGVRAHFGGHRRCERHHRRHRPSACSRGGVG